MIMPKLAQIYKGVCYMLATLR